MAPQKARLRYHCVEIIAGPGGCKAAVALKKHAPAFGRRAAASAGNLRYSRRSAIAATSTMTTVGPDPAAAAETGSGVRPWAQTNRRKARGRRDADFE